MIRLRRARVLHGIGQGLARAGIVGLAAATMSGVGIAGALAQEHEGVSGGMTVDSAVADENVPSTESIGTVPAPELPRVEVPVPGAVNAVMGGEELPPPVDLSVVGEGVSSPADISAILAGLGLPATGAGESEPTLGPEISVGATPGGDASGTITMGGGEGSVSLGGDSSGSGAVGG